MKKKLLSMMLALAMVLSVASVGAAAEEFNDHNFEPAEGYYLATERQYIEGDLYTTLTYTYDSEWTLQYCTVTYDGYGESGSYNIYYTYDANGYLVREDWDGGMTVTYVYDSLGRLVKETTTDDWGSYGYTYTYNSNGDVAKISCYFDGDFAYSTSYTYTYDANGNVIVQEDDDGAIFNYTYDDAGNLIEETASYDWGDDEPELVETIVYTYDTHGNLLAKRYFYYGEYEGDCSIYTYYTADSTGEVIELPTFVDVMDSSTWYFNAVLWAVEEGITAGTTTTTFSPNSSCTRAQIVSFLWRAAGSPEPETTENPFTDVKESAYYYKAVLWAVENGITYGTTDTTFSPNATCTRAQAMCFLYRYEGEPEVDATATAFTDVAETAYYAAAVAWGVQNGITAGITATTFAPENTCTRAHIVCFLYRDLA